MRRSFGVVALVSLQLRQKEHTAGLKIDTAVSLQNTSLAGEELFHLMCFLANEVRLKKQMIS